MENYYNIGNGSNIQDIIFQIIRSVVSTPLYHEASHKVNAMNYPNGALEYFNTEKYKLINTVGQRSMVGNAWKNSSCLKISYSLIVNYYSECRHKLPIRQLSEEEYINFVKEDFTIFMRDYYAYNRFLKEIRKQDPNPTSLGFKIDISTLTEIFDNLRKGECIPKETDYDYFKYAFKGDGIPSHKQPYQPIKWLHTKERLYLELKDIETQHEGKTQVSLTNARKKVKDLFLDKNGKPMKMLTKPK